MSAPRKFDETRARAVRLYQDRLRDQVVRVYLRVRPPTGLKVGVDPER